MEEIKVIPKAMQYMVDESNRQLREIQQTLTKDVMEASLELMTLLGISPDAGWKMDVDRMVYVRQIPDLAPDTSPTANAPIVE
jgi:hypothetical protein